MKFYKDTSYQLKPKSFILHYSPTQQYSLFDLRDEREGGMEGMILSMVGQSEQEIREYLMKTLPEHEVNLAIAHVTETGLSWR